MWAGGRIALSLTFVPASMKLVASLARRSAAKDRLPQMPPANSQPSKSRPDPRHEVTECPRAQIVDRSRAGDPLERARTWRKLAPVAGRKFGRDQSRDFAAAQMEHERKRGVAPGAAWPCWFDTRHLGRPHLSHIGRGK